MNKKTLFIKVIVAGSIFTAVCLADVALFFVIGSNMLPIFMLSLVPLAGAFGFLVLSLTGDYFDLNNWFEQILDFVYLPLSVTDLDMKWTFMNASVKDIIGVDRAEALGEHCSKWNADICNTEKCGVAMLRRGLSQSFFTNEGVDRNFQVDTTYLYDRKRPDKKIGHLELVSDVTTKVRLESAVGQLKKGSESFAHTIEDEASTTAELSAASQEFSRNISSINESVQKQFQVIEETVSALEEMSASIVTVSNHSGNVSGKSQENVDQARSGEATIKEMISAVSDFSEGMKNIVQRVNGLGEKTEKVDEILKVINNIVSQTNLLAMNAAIEAAHAGESGKGFSVVSDEIRKLAEGAQISSKEIELIIREIKDEIKDTITMAEGSSAVIEKSKADSTLSLESIDQIVQNASNMGSMIVEIESIAKEQAFATNTILDNAKGLKNISNEIKNALSEQSSGIVDITKGLETLSSGTQRNVTSADELMEMAGRLEL